MDTWYAINNVMQWINSLGYKFICPIRKNRQILDLWTNPNNPKYRAVKDLPWDNDEELMQGKNVKLKACSLKLKLFRIMIHSNRTDYVITNDKEAISTSKDARKACGFRWKIEQYHCEVKQITGIGKCQCRITAKITTRICKSSHWGWIDFNGF